MDHEKYWVDTCHYCTIPTFIFINPEGNGKCTMIYNLKEKQKMKTIVFYNACRNVTSEEYVTYKLLGYLDE